MLQLNKLSELILNNQDVNQLIEHFRSDTERFEHFVWVKQIVKVQHALSLMEQQAEEAQTPHSSGVEKLIVYLKQNYKDVLSFDATKQFFQQTRRFVNKTNQSLDS